MVGRPIEAAFSLEKSRVARLAVEERASVRAGEATFIQRLHTLLDDRVANKSRAGVNASLMQRIGSIGAIPQQVQHYARLAANLPPSRSVCEVGFNAGHSAAVFLASTDPSTVLHTFDLFSTHTMRSSLRLLNETFPGRIRAYAGDSLVVIPGLREKIQPACGLLHIDGRHDYTHTLADAIHLFPHAAPDATFLFDDQCIERLDGRRALQRAALF